MTRVIATLTALVTCAALALPARAQDEAKPPKIFSDDRVIAATLEAPWSDISRNKRKDQDWQGSFSFTSSNGQEVKIPVTISLRGLTRLRICDFPPLRLDFEKAASKGTEFRGAGNLKLVTHCFRSEKYAQYYVKEYLSYRIYNLVTPMSYRVQGLELTYRDSEDGDTKERFGFLIEDPDDVAKRNDMEKLNIPKASPSRLDAHETTRMVLFQYMIANLDWSMLSGPKENCCHNARLIGANPEAATVYAIPYDLDSSGLVDSHYAAPPDNLSVRDVRQRLYRGLCAHNDAIPAVMEEYRTLQPEIMALFENDPRLSKRSRADSLKFLNGFYKYLEDDKDINKRLIGKCRG